MKLVVIDDNPHSLTLLREIVRDGWPRGRVLTAANGPAGIELAAAEDPDVILLDTNPPGLEALELCRQLKADERTKDVPVLFITAPRIDVASRVKALEAGADGFLTRPLEPSELTAQIRTMVKVKVANRRHLIERAQPEASVGERTEAVGERTEAEEELRRLRLIVRDIPIGLYVYHLQDLSDDRTLRMTYANPTVEVLTGLAPDDVVGRTLDENFPGLRARGIPQRFAGVVRTQTGVSFEHITHGDDGVPLAAFAVRAFPLPGRHVGVAFQSITQRTAALDRQIRYNGMLRRISMSLINLPLTQLDDVVSAALAQVGAFFQADRAYMFDYDLAGGTTTNTFEWCAPGIEPAIGTMQRLPITAISGVSEQHRRGDAVMIPSVRDLPPGSLRDLLESQGIRSLLTVPVMAGGVCLGFVGLDAVRQSTLFSDQEHDLLTLFAELLANLTGRRHHEAELQQRLGELQQWYDVTLDREERVLELKREADALRQRLGEPPRYAVELGTAQADAPVPGPGPGTAPSAGPRADGAQP